MVRGKLKLGGTVYRAGLPSRADIPGRIVAIETVNFGLWKRVRVEWEDGTESVNVAQELNEFPPGERGQSGPRRAEELSIPSRKKSTI